MNVPTLDRCPGYNLYIGGVISLRRPQALRNCNITHIVSVLDWKFDDDSALLKDFRHLHIPVDDVEDENLLEWFPRSNAFIQQGLESGPAQDLGDTAHVATSTTTTAMTGSAANERQSGVLIHCAMGKSRSATILLAYLLWASRQLKPQDIEASGRQTTDSEMVSIPPEPLSVVKALELLRRGRPIAEPNEGFMDQLNMYEAMRCPTSEDELKRHKIYRRWMNKRSVEESLRINQAPEMAHILFEDEADHDEDPNVANQMGGRGGDRAPKDQSATARSLLEKKESHMKEVAPGLSAPDGTLSSATSPTNPVLVLSSDATQQLAIKCRRCRHILATKPFILDHEPPPHRDPNERTQQRQPATTTEISTTTTQTQASPLCAHIFLHPLSWMRDVLSEGTMEGRLSCPNQKCGANVGKFAWTGLRCSCGGWVTPGFGLIRGKVDEVITRPRGLGHSRTPNEADPGSIGGGGLRLPPGMIRRGNL